MTLASRRVALASLLSVAALGSAVEAQPSKPDEQSAEPRREPLADTRWSMILPDGSWEEGCATGYMALQLRGNHFFIFNNRLTGVWSMIKPELLRLRTRTGAVFALSMEGESLKSAGALPATGSAVDRARLPLQPPPPARAGSVVQGAVLAPFRRVQRDAVFARCSE